MFEMWWNGILVLMDFANHLHEHAFIQYSQKQQYVLDRISSVDKVSSDCNNVGCTESEHQRGQALTLGDCA